MGERTPNQFHRLLPFSIVAGTVLIFPLLAIFNEDGVILFVPLAMIAGLALFIRAIIGKGSRRLSACLALMVLCAASFALCRKYDDIRVALRWALWSKNFKAAVLAQPSRSNSELKHVEWDAWGLAIVGGPVYVVFDPSNALDRAVVSNASDVVLTPLPHAASKVRRLEKS